MKTQKIRGNTREKRSKNQQKTKNFFKKMNKLRKPTEEEKKQGKMK